MYGLSLKASRGRALSQGNNPNNYRNTLKTLGKREKTRVGEEQKTALSEKKGVGAGKMQPRDSARGL
jgi:hypothetical protein